ncbi:tetratricopeptide repeat protein [Hyphomonas sp. WL0036]|uniref:tetratricopeptide repeat protein n=1 Tax=Hyphomonas sediminis TaxID=2866160 RepID=UPI001C819D09|nr:tetratricopeptide repeat protein [Hyphomonas sediminis]MBY9065363.1 tetratricopeptide repeat protein [Hyphomonas sediminis]
MKPFFSTLLLAGLVTLGGCASSGPHGPSYNFSEDRPPEASSYRDFMIARIASLTNDPETAALSYGAVIDAMPDKAPIAERAVFSALLAGDYAVAVGLAHRASEAGSQASLVRLTLATDAITRSRAQKARPWLEGEGLPPFNRSIANNLSAWVALEKGGLSDAAPFVEQQLTGDMRFDSPSLYMLGLLQMSAGETKAAIETFEKVWTSGARLAVGVEAHAELLAAGGDRERALELIDTFRADVGVNASLASLADRIESGVRIKPRRLSTRQGAALSFYVPAAALMYQTEDDLSSVYFVLALALDPNLHVARSLWAQALENGGRRDDAIRILREVPPSSDYYANARGQLANLLNAENRSEEALQVAAEALAGNPDRGLKLQLADLYISRERYTDGEAILSEVIASDGEQADWRVIFARGAARERQGSWEAAEADLKHALELRPENATILNYLGYSWIDRGINLEEGFSLIRRAVILEPLSGHIVDSLGWAYYRLGKYEEAVDFLERAVELMPGDPTLNDHLGDAYWMAGRHLEAGFQWNRALKLDPGEEDRTLIEEKLRTGLVPEPAPATLQ